MAMAHPNETVVRQAYDAFVWHEAGNPEPIQGREALQQRLGMASQLENDIDLHAILADDDHVVSLVRARLRKPNGTEVSYPVVEVVHVKDGMISERWSFMDATPEDVQDFFADLG